VNRARCMTRSAPNNNKSYPPPQTNLKKFKCLRHEHWSSRAQPVDVRTQRHHLSINDNVLCHLQTHTRIRQLIVFIKNSDRFHWMVSKCDVMFFYKYGRILMPSTLFHSMLPVIVAGLNLGCSDSMLWDSPDAVPIQRIASTLSRSMKSHFAPSCHRS
jgi:hypothetical protein